jgi:WD40 repeat protein
MRLLLIFITLFAFNLPLTSAQTTITPTEIMRIGRGVAYSIDWRRDEKVLAVGTATGVWLYSDDYELLAHFPEAGQQVAWSPDGVRLLTWTESGGGQIWRIDSDGKSGEIVLTIPHLVRGAWSPDGSMIAGRRLMGEQVAPVVWNSKTSEVLFELPAEDAHYRVAGVGIDLERHFDFELVYPYLPNSAWNAAGEKLAVGNFSSIEIYDVSSSFEFMDELTIAKDDYRLMGSEIAWVGDRIFSNGQQNFNPFIWDANSGEQLTNPNYCDGNYCSDTDIIQITPSPDHNKIAFILKYYAVSEYGVARTPSYATTILDATTVELIAENRDMNFTDIAWKGNDLTGVTPDGDLRLWSEEIAIPYLSEPPKKFMVWSPNSQLLVTGGAPEYSDREPLVVWNTSATDNRLYEPLTVLRDLGNQGELFWNEQVGLVSIAYYPDYYYPFVRGLRRFLDGYGLLPVGKNGLRWRHSIYDVPEALPQGYGRLSPDLSYTAFIDWDVDAIEIRDANSNEVLHTFNLFQDTQGSVEVLNQMAWSPDSSKIAISFDYWHSNTGIWNVQTGTLLAAIDQISETKIFWSPNSQLLLALDIQEGEVTNEDVSPVGIPPTTTTRLIDADSGDILATQTTPNWSDEVAWKPDGNLFAVNVATEFIQFRDGDTGELVAEAAIDGEYKLAWSPDGTRLALGGQDGVIRIWDVSEVGKNEQD